jgi:predicted transcriptional regulator
MAEKRIRSRTISLEQRQGTFNTILGRFMGEKKQEISDVSLLRSLLSNEKARLLHVLKTKQPNSIYELAKILGRGFKSVRQDLAVFQEYGLIEMIPIHKGKREKLKPLLVLDEIKINIQI